MICKQVQRYNDFSILDSDIFSNELEKVKQDFNAESYANQWLEECERNKGSEAVEVIRVRVFPSSYY